MEPTVTYVLIGFTSLVSLFTFNKPVFLKLTLNPYRMHHHREYFRFITSGFIHAGIMHLVLNMLALYFFGSLIEIYFLYIFGDAGLFYYVVLYLTGIVVSDIPTFFKNRNNPRYNSVGASGAVAAVVFVSIMLDPLNSICLYFVLCLPGFILGTVFIIWSYFNAKKANDNINHEAHLYGALYGLLFAVIMIPSVIPNFIEQILSWRF